jgi:hypothetical protein
MLTLCAIGLWYWFRVPYEIVHERPPGAGPLRRGDEYLEVESVRRTWDGTVRHGPRRISLNGKLYQIENYRDGLPHGKWQWLNGVGHSTITAEFRLGRLTNFQASSRCDQRLARLLAEGKLSDPRIVRELLRDSSLEYVETPLKDALVALKDQHAVPIELIAMARVPGFSLDMPITCQAEGPLIETIGAILQPHELVSDYRYGMLYVVSREGVENWKDETGVTRLVPPPRSKLERHWDEMTMIEFIETPLGDALQIISDRYGVQFFDTSRLPAELAQSRTGMPVTLKISGNSLRNSLAAMFDVLDLQTRLDGEKIVIELQPDHPALQKP